ncbi:MAG: YdcF family protein [Myxococcales bacterium]|nr:YdcF family protein [Myxococcales bacterium]
MRAITSTASRTTRGSIPSAADRRPPAADGFRMSISPGCRCRPVHRGEAVDAAALNGATLARIPSYLKEPREVDCLIVPGYTPRFGWPAGRLHPKAARRCAAAVADLAAGIAPLAIVSGGAVHNPDNEALLMREELLAAGVPGERILVEPCARHTTTNLRNAGRIMLAHDLRIAWVVTSDATYESLHHWIAHRFIEQAYYLGYPRLSTFHWRCRRQLGFTVGKLDWAHAFHVRFVPSPDCGRESPRPTREGDP